MIDRFLGGGKERLDVGGEFSVEQLREIGLGPIRRSSGGRSLLYVSEMASVNLVPQDLADTLNDLYKNTSDERLVLQTLFSAFHLYRRCVNTGFEAALARNGSSFEWPRPTLFSWKDIDAINFIGTAMGSMESGENVKISVREGDRLIVTELATGLVEEKVMLGMAGDPPVNFKYKIDKLADVRMINSQTWQQITLRAYATSVMCVLDDLKRAKGKDPNSESFVRDLIAEFPNMKLNFPVGRYTKPHEKTDAQFLFALI